MMSEAACYRKISGQQKKAESRQKEFEQFISAEIYKEVYIHG